MKNPLRKLQSRLKTRAPSAPTAHAGPSHLSMPDLPIELIIRVSSFLDQPDLARLALTCTAFVDPVESILWREVQVLVPPPKARWNEDERKQVPGRVTLGWQRLGEALDRRPIRMKHIRRLMIPSTMSSGAMPIITRILPRLPSLVRMCDYGIVVKHAQKPLDRLLHRLPSRPSVDVSLSIFTALREAGPLLGVQDLLLDYSFRNVTDTLQVLHQFPNLVHLHITTFTLLGDDQVSAFQRPPDLPHLESLSLLTCGDPGTSSRLGPVFAMMERAPRLSQLDLSLGFDRAEKTEDLENLFRSQQIRHFRLDGYTLPFVVDQDLIVSGWMPNLETLTLVWGPLPSCIPAHPTLRLLYLRSHNDAHRVVEGVAWEAEPDCTWFLSKWMTTALENSPSLLYIDDYVPHDHEDNFTITYDRAIVTGFRFVTFTNGGDTLFHGRKRRRCTEQGTIEGSEEWLTMNRGNIIRHELVYNGIEWIRLTHSDSESSAEERLHTLAVHELDNDPRNESVDMTSFDGRALPYSLLDYIYSQTEYKREWDEGARDLELPAHVWQYLRDWRDEIASVAA